MLADFSGKYLQAWLLSVDTSLNIIRTGGSEIPSGLAFSYYKLMDDKSNLVFYASGSRKYEHLYLRGNFQQEMFFDKVDLINVWNRIWISAYATGVQVLSLIIVNNHFHLTVRIRDNEQRANFMHYLRLSITQYHNRRYKVRGTLGTRRLNHAELKDLEDIKDCICYHIRNVLHHGISKNFMNYQFSTARYVFKLAVDKQQGVYTRKILPPKLGAYLPVREDLPESWTMTEEGMIVPPSGVFRPDLVETLFGSRKEYLNTLSNRTTRESDDREEPDIRIYASHSRKIQDEEIAEFVKNEYNMAIPSMNTSQKMDAAKKVIETYPKVSRKLLSRLFGIPYTTLIYRLHRC